MKNDDILKAARDRLCEAREAEEPHIRRAESDLRFLSGENQWPESERAAREADNRPALVFNSLPQYVRQIAGQIRQMNPSIKVSPGDDKASEDVAEIYEGLIREIEYRCDAPSIYEGAAESAVQCGIGHFRIRADYVDGETFDQHVVIERIHNPFAVYYDPFAKEPSRADARYCFVVDQMPKEDFEEAYPDAKVTDFADATPPVWYQHWRGGERVTVAEYYWLEIKEYDLYRLPGGQIVRDLPEELRKTAQKRRARRPVVMWCKTNGEEILEGPQRVAGEHIPVVSVVGEELHIGEEVYRSGAIRQAKDSQVAYNVMRTASIESTMLQPRAPYMVTARQVAGLEDFWNQANRTNRPYLPYNVDEKAPAPQRVPPPVQSSALVSEAQIAAEDMKRTTGIYDASLGARSNETSGRAINSRQQQAEIANSIYADNMVKAVMQAGRVIVAMIPEIYDADRVVRVLGDDAQERMVKINEAQTQVVQGVAGPTVVAAMKNSMTDGKYAVRVSVGPSYTTRKQESASNMLEFMQRLPNVAPAIADLIAGAQEWPDADRIAERLRKMVPPPLLEESEKDQADPQAMAAKQQQAMQAQQQAQQQQVAAEAGLRKQVAEAEEAEADAEKAKAEALKAKIELMALQGRVLPPMNVGPVAPVPGYPG